MMNGFMFKKDFDRLYLPLCMYSLRILNIKEEAEDVVQQGFASTWERINRGEEIDDLKSYMYGTVRNLSLLKLRHMNRIVTVEIENVENVSEEDIDTSERDAALWKAIGDLPERCREIFLMSKQEGLSHKEIADRLGISTKTIENQMTKAYSRLQEALEPKGRAVFFLPFL